MLQELFGEYTVAYSNWEVGRLTVSLEGLMVRFTCECVVATAEILRLAILVGDRYVLLGVLLPDGDKLRFTKQYSKIDLQSRGLTSIDGCRLVTGHDALPTAAPASAPTPTPTPTPAIETIAATPDPITETLAPKPEPKPEPQPAPVPEPEPELTPKPEPTPEPEPDPAPEPEPAPQPDPHWDPVRELGDDKVLYIHTAHIPAPEMEPPPPEPPIAEPPTAKWTPHPNPGILFTDPDLVSACTHISGALTRPCGGDCIELAVRFEAGQPFPLLPIFCHGHAIDIDGRPHLVFRIKNGNLVK